MIRRNGLILLVLAVLLALGAPLGWSWTQGEIARFEDANELYRQKQLDQAVAIYEELLIDHPYAATLYFNLGNSYFRSGVIGKALLNYERALTLDPRNSDIRHNLNHAEGLLEYHVEDKRNWYLKAGENVLRNFTYNEIGILGLGSFFFFALSWCAVLFFKQGAPWGWKRKTLLILTLLFASLAALKHVESRMIQDAIVMTEEAEFRFGPSDADQVAFRLGEGHKVYVVDRRKGWSRVVLINGEGGWVRNDKIAEAKI